MLSIKCFSTTLMICWFVFMITPLLFKARIVTEDGFISYKKEQGVYSNVYQAKDFLIANIKRSNETNGDNTGYFNFTVQLSSRVYKNEYFKITPPAGINILPGGD